MEKESEKQVLNMLNDVISTMKSTSLTASGLKPKLHEIIMLDVGHPEPEIYLKISDYYHNLLGNLVEFDENKFYNPDQALRELKQIRDKYSQK